MRLLGLKLASLDLQDCGSGLLRFAFWLQGGSVGCTLPRNPKLPKNIMCLVEWALEGTSLQSKVSGFVYHEAKARLKFKTSEP